MPWTVALLRGQRVIARTKADGTLAVEGGRVEIRYRATDPRAYRASASNLNVPEGAETMSDAAVVAGEEVKSDGAAKSAPKPARLDKKDAEPVRDANGWIAFTDGACSGNPGPAGSGVVVIQPGGKIDEGFAFLGTATNNIAELTAIQLALEAVPIDAPSLLVHTDSQYAIGVLAKGWKAKSNQELVARIKALLHDRPQVRLRYVPGHAGVPMNERADELAREAIRTRHTKTIRL